MMQLLTFTFLALVLGVGVVTLILVFRGLNSVKKQIEEEREDELGDPGKKTGHTDTEGQ